MAYAVITSTDPSYLYTAKALCRGLTMYSNDCDIHLLHTEDMPLGWTVDLPARVHTHLISEFPEMAQVATDPIRGRPWQVRFARYVLAAQLCKAYDVVAIWDSDSFVVGEIMGMFEYVADTKIPALPRNPYGMPWSPNSKCDIVHATQPTFHCHGAFFPSNYDKLLYEVYLRGLHEPYGDMVALHRVLQQILTTEKDRIRALPNEDWVCSLFWQKPVRVVYYPEPVVYFGDEIITCVHGKWHLAEVRKKMVMTQVFSTEARIQAVKNVLRFDEVYQWFNQNKVDHE